MYIYGYICVCVCSRRDARPYCDDDPAAPPAWWPKPAPGREGKKRYRVIYIYIYIYIYICIYINKHIYI